MLDGARTNWLREWAAQGEDAQGGAAQGRAAQEEDGQGETGGCGRYRLKKEN